jgi:hypothetical protein
MNRKSRKANHSMMRKSRKANHSMMRKSRKANHSMMRKSRRSRRSNNFFGGFFQSEMPEVQVARGMGNMPRVVTAAAPQVSMRSMMGNSGEVQQAMRANLTRAPTFGTATNSRMTSMM